ncbi:MAG TPA: hypothetical protein PKO15_09685, partial [Fibrobacteria bacterium]|nr:hypothetical protein [Fibrobacteria bacterium]
MRDPIPTRLPSLAAIAGLLLCACDDSRVVSGPSGTETGNALQARILREDGSAAGGAVVAVRRSTALDQDGTFILVADPSGRVSTRLEAGEWTLEARDGGQGLRLDMRLASDTSLDEARLARLGAVAGRLQSTVPSPTLAIPGLGRQVAVASDGTFFLDSLPAGTQPLVLAGTSSSWSLKVPSGTTDSILLDERRPGELFQHSPIRAQVSGSILPKRFILPGLEKGWTLAETEWTDSLGNVVPVFPLSDSGASIPAWTYSRDPAVLQPRRILSGRSTSGRVFQRDDGFRLALVFPLRAGMRPDGDTAEDLVSGSTMPLVSDGGFLVDPAEGRVRRAPIGSTLLRIDTGLLSPDQGTISVRASLEQPDLGRIWLVDWTDSVSSGIRVGIGAGALFVR